MNESSAKVRRMIWVSLGVLALTLLLAAYAWAVLPAGASIPIHWNAAGEVDGYGSKAVGLLLIPATVLGLTALFALIPRIDPRGDNILRSWEAYRIVWVGMLLLMLAIQVITVLSATGRITDMGRLIPVGVGLLFIVMGNAFGKIRPNYMFGVRTPWTIASELSWNKTHRVAGWMFVGLGMIMIAGVFVPNPETWVWLMMAGLMALLVVVIVYSYIVWKNDPEKRPISLSGKEPPQEPPKENQN